MGSLTSALLPIAARLSDAPRVYADANLPYGAVTFMRQTLHWDVLFVLEHPDLRRASDAQHFQRALDLGRTLITLDHDFFNERRFPPASSPGVVVCTAPDEQGLKRLLAHLDGTLRADPPVDLPFRGKTISRTVSDL